MKIPAEKLPPPVLTQAQVDARVRALAVRGDPLTASSFTGVNLTSGVDGKVGATGLSIRFTSMGTGFTVNRIEQMKDDHDVSMFLTPAGRSEKLAGLKIMVNDLLLTWDEAQDRGGGEYRWPAQAANTVIVGRNDVTIYEPWNEGNLVPGGAPADDGKVLKRTAEGPAWGTMAYSDLTGPPPDVIKEVDGPITSVVISNTDDPVAQQELKRTTPVFDLDDYQYGEFRVSVTLTATARSVNTLGLGDEADITYRLTDVIFASTLRAVPAFTSGGSNKGEPIDNDVEVYNGSAKLGTLQVYLARDSLNRVGYLIDYKGGGTARASLTVAATMELSFSPTDAPAATSKGIRAGDLRLTGTAAITFSDGLYVPKAWSGTANGYTAGANGQIWVPKTKELIGWMVKSLVDNVVIDTATVLKLPGYKAGFQGPSATITFKNNADSSVNVRFQSFSTRGVHRINVYGRGNEVPGNARLELYEWV